MEIFCHFNFCHNRRNRFCCTVCGLIWAHYKAFSISIIIICVHSHPMIAPFFWENLTPYFYCSAVSPRLLQTFRFIIWLHWKKKSFILLSSIYKLCLIYIISLQWLYVSVILWFVFSKLCAPIKHNFWFICNLFFLRTYQTVRQQKSQICISQPTLEVMYIWSYIL